MDKLILEIIENAKVYKKRFGRPLGVIGEIGEHIVAQKFNLKLAEFQNPSFDALNSIGEKIQIKSRIFSRPATDRVGTVKKGGFDKLLVASFSEDFELIDAYLLDATTLEQSLPIGNGKNQRNPSLSLIKKHGRNLKSGNEWTTV